MPFSEYIVLTKIFEYLETPNVQCGGVCTRRLQGNHRLQIPQGCGRIATSGLEGETTQDSGSLGLRYTADGTPSEDYGFWMKLLKYRGENSRISQCGPTAFTALRAQ